MGAPRWDWVGMLQPGITRRCGERWGLLVSACEVSQGTRLCLRSSVGRRSAPQGPLARAWSSAAGVGCDSPALRRREHDCNGEGKTFHVLPVPPASEETKLWPYAIDHPFNLGYSCLHLFKMQATPGFVRVWGWFFFLSFVPRFPSCADPA